MEKSNQLRRGLSRHPIDSKLPRGAAKELSAVARQKNQRIDYVIIEEASLGTRMDLMIHLMLCDQNTRVILIGDDMQLKTVTRHSNCCVLGISALEWAMKSRSVNSHHQLTNCYRLPPFMCWLIGKNFYNNTLKCHWKYDAEKYSWFLANGMSTFTEQLLPDKEEESKEGNSYFNEDEIMFLYQFLEKLCTFRRCPKSIQIAILCGYNAQRNKVLERLQNDLDLLKRLEQLNMNVGTYTVDSFQGHEADIVLIMTTKTGKAGFFQKNQRINVALSRTKMCNLLMYNLNTMKSAGIWSELIQCFNMYTLWEEEIKTIETEKINRLMMKNWLDTPLLGKENEDLVGGTVLHKGRNINLQFTLILFNFCIILYFYYF
ncbi:hypothetical protein RCL1_001086 [Eukaryota sp. TZLM3-RCL]